MHDIASPATIAGAGVDWTASSTAGGRRMTELTARETQVLGLIVSGLSAKEVARELSIAPRTVERHLDHIRLKTRTRNRSHLVALAIGEGLIGKP